MTAPAPTTAPAPLRDRPAARSGEIVSGDARPARPAAFTRPLPAPPAPVPPLAPPARGQHVVPTRQRVLAPAVGGVAAARLPALRSGRVARLLAAAVVTLAVIGGLGWIGMAPSSEIPAETVVARVGAGETIWDVARRVAPEHDQREVVERIRQLNGMAGSAVAPGQQLRVPRGRIGPRSDALGHVASRAVTE